MAAPTKLTPDRQERLCAAISAGNYYETACALAGIDYTTFRHWMREGETATSGAKRQFFNAVTRAQAEAEDRVVALWQAKIPDDWQAARDFLARRHPERWGRTVQDTRHQGHDGQGPVEIKHDHGDVLARALDSLAAILDADRPAADPGPPGAG